MGTPSFFGISWKPMLSPIRTASEPNHEPHADVGVVDVAGEAGAREHLVRAGVRLPEPTGDPIGAHSHVVGVDDPHAHLVLGVDDRAGRDPRGTARRCRVAPASTVVVGASVGGGGSVGSLLDAGATCPPGLARRRHATWLAIGASTSPPSPAIVVVVGRWGSRHRRRRADGSHAERCGTYEQRYNPNPRLHVEQASGRPSHPSRGPTAPQSPGCSPPTG